MSNIVNFSSANEKFTQESIQGLENLIDEIEKGNITSYITAAYCPKEGVVVYYSKPEGTSIYEIMGHVEMLKEYLIMKVGGF
jgi:hypothetical protein